jgi:excinuclease ABC subunit A
LEVKYKGKSISEVLDMTIDQAVDFFENQPSILNKIKTLQDVGLGYIKLGQSSTTLSGGESQRVKLATELSKRDTGKTLYILDEPTTGLHFEDIRVLLGVLNRLANKGNTVIIIEHNMEVIKSSDYIIDLGPEGGEKGGFVTFEGTPEMMANLEGNYTADFLKEKL